MSQTRPELFDHQALRRNRARARRAQSDLFLQTTARDELKDRLTMVNKSFHAPAVVTPFGEVWEGHLDHAKIVDDDLVLDLEEGAHDLVIHALGLHWANDPVGQLIQCRRALEPDGLFLCACLGGETLAELRGALAKAEAEVSGGLSPRVAPMGEVRQLGALLQRAGLALPVADQIALNTRYKSPLHLMHDLRTMGEANVLADRRSGFTPRALLMRAAEFYVAQHGDQDGSVPATFDLVVLTGWSPDASQPQPLRPGSATNRLADALGVNEAPLQD